MLVYLIIVVFLIQGPAPAGRGAPAAKGGAAPAKTPAPAEGNSCGIFVFLCVLT